MALLINVHKLCSMDEIQCAFLNTAGSTCLPCSAGIEEQEEADPRGPMALNMAAVSMRT